MSFLAARWSCRYVYIELSVSLSYYNFLCVESLKSSGVITPSGELCGRREKYEEEKWAAGRLLT
jgi:hypothetical protein